MADQSMELNSENLRSLIDHSSDITFKDIYIGSEKTIKVTLFYIRGLINRDSLSNFILKPLLENPSISSAEKVEEVVESIELGSLYYPNQQKLWDVNSVASDLFNGKVLLIFDDAHIAFSFSVEGLPVALILPATFLQFMQAPEDYSQIFIYSSAIRLLRFILAIITLYLPGFYVAVLSFHQEMIPTQLALSIQVSKEGVPFPAFIETLGLLIAFEILVESGIRLPKTVGQALSIVGAVIVGLAAVEAKLVSPAVVVMVAATAISSYVIPNQDFSNALRLWRFIITIFSSIAGLFGMSIGGLLLLYHLCTIDNFGVSYLSPFVSSNTIQYQDTLIRTPIFFMKKRPVNLKTTNKKRQPRWEEMEATNPKRGLCFI